MKARLSYANVMATVAVFIALGGTAAALKANSVGSKELKRNAVRGKHIKKAQVKSSDLRNENLRSIDIRDDEIGSSDLRNGGVRSADVEDGSLLATDVANGSLTGTDLLDGTLNGIDVADGGLGASELATGSVGSGAVADGAITGTDIAESTLGAVPDADRVGGLDPGSLVRAAGDSSEDLLNVDGERLSAQITAPTSGFLSLDASVALRNQGTGTSVVPVLCELQLDDSSHIAGTQRLVHLDGDRTDGGGDSLSNVNTHGTCATNAVVPVAAGSHTVDVEMLFVGAGTDLFGGTLNVLFVPFDGSGN